VGMALLVGLTAVAPARAQDDITFTASVDKTQLSTDQTLTLKLTLQGAFRNADKPQFPTLDGFAVIGSSQSSQFSMVNGETTAKVVYTYRLQPTKSGALTIPAIQIEVKGQSYESNPVAIEVTPGDAPPAQAPTSQPPGDATAPDALTNQDIYVEAEVDQAAPVVGEQIIYTFRLYQAINFFNQPQLNWPDFTNFLSYDLSPNNQYYQTVNGREYLVTEVRRALFPTSAGETTIGPSQLLVPGDFFNQKIERETNAVAVDVQPLPEGAPADFGGAVGRFELTAEVEPGTTRVNEPVTLRVTVTGDGNISAVNDPTAVGAEALPGWRIYDPQIATDLDQVGEVIQGTKQFERLLVPRTEGALTIPPFSLTYYDPAAGEYRRAAAEALTVQVAPGDEEPTGSLIVGENGENVVVLGSDIRHIKPAPPALATRQAPLTARPLYWIGWLVPLMAVGGAWGWDRRRQAMARDVAYARRVRARKAAHQRLTEARRVAATDEDAAYGAVARALTHYLADKFNLPPAGLTRAAIRQALQEHGAPADLRERVLAALDWADSGRFAPVAAGRDANDLIQEAEHVIAALEEILV
ncbi:MAG: BatD family protein, partial [Anaerolineales bacterium]